MHILAINAGSSSIKFAAYQTQTDGSLKALSAGVLEGLEPQGQPRMKWHDAQGQAQQVSLPQGAADPHAAALAVLQASLQDWGLGQIDAIAHRIVHGGDAYSASVRLDEAVLQQLERYTPLAPLHQPHNLAGVRAFMRQFPQAVQVGCFDTAFHSHMPALNRRLPLPDRITSMGVRRYGFHGLSYQFICQTLLPATPRGIGKTIMAHLGSGASLCAMEGGVSLATTMSFSALDGLMMGTRPGHLDTGVLLYLMQQGWSAQQLETMLYKESGLLGVSGISGDMRTLRASDQPRAAEAIALFEQRIVQEIGSLSATMGGLDVLVFSGGIGENDAATRLAVCQRLVYLGLGIDADLNAKANGCGVCKISLPASRVEVWVLPTDEGSIAAQEALGLLVG
jgi:acetate kinase